MEERQVREMWISPHKNQQPLYSGATVTWIFCGECGKKVWPAQEKEKGPRAPKASEAAG